MALVALYVKVFRRTPEKIYKWVPLSQNAELGSLAYPMVLVQIPMFNERELLSLLEKLIALCIAPGFIRCQSEQCAHLHDSTDITIRELVQEEYYEPPPPPEFLIRTIPFLVHNPALALVQARWKFVNANECMRTRIQEMSSNYHFKVEQQSGSSAMAFFGFNGTAGVWRILAINEAGGWKERTTVEDMDLAVRATLHGWKFVYVGDLKVRSEENGNGYSNGQEGVFAEEALLAVQLLLREKDRLPRRDLLLLLHRDPGLLLLPRSCHSQNGVCLLYVPTAITLLNSIGTPRSLHLTVIWMFFIGLLEAGRANEWVITDKRGDASKTKQASTAARRLPDEIWKRFHLLEMGMGGLLLTCACYDCRPQ
ncbi:hypothetical protein OPV22_023075 [Ensete ventricosum]|uniref:Glycosyltransferase 2-like domain-containing protein n=1 Tax=Ensete ventricosum TaxID=4639 RepID=A0AAV8QR83_ENSVE|nr:hypothetical protein OPV22_023075 [Ensete ventricosum]